MREVTEFLRASLNLEASPEKSKVSKASDGTVFLGYQVQADTGNRVRRTRLGRRVVRSRDAADHIHLRVPRDRLVRFNQRKGYGDLGRLKAIHRRYLIDSSVLEIVLAYNAEMRGLANFYRLAYFAKYSLRKLWFLWQTSLLKTLSFKLRLSVNQVARRLRTGNGLAVRFTVDGKERVVEVFNLKHLDRLPWRWMPPWMRSSPCLISRRHGLMSSTGSTSGSANTVARPTCRARSIMPESSRI